MISGFEFEELGGGTFFLHIPKSGIRGGVTAYANHPRTLRQDMRVCCICTDCDWITRYQIIFKIQVMEKPLRTSMLTITSPVRYAMFKG